MQMSKHKVKVHKIKKIGTRTEEHCQTEYLKLKGGEGHAEIPHDYQCLKMMHVQRTEKIKATRFELLEGAVER